MKTKRLMAILGSVTTVAWLLVASAACNGCSDDDNGGNNNVNQNNNNNNNNNNENNNENNNNVNQNNNNEQKKLTVIETTDIHSHASGFDNFLDYTPLDTSDHDDVIGGLSRIATVINQIRAQKAEENVPVVLVDDGDFFMGTTYDMATDYPVALMFFQAMGYTASNIGNHEYDWGPTGLAMLYNNAVTNGFSVPVLVSNTVFDATSDADDALEALKTGGVLMDKYVTTLDNGLKIGFLGNMGPQADQMAPTAPPVTFDHDYSFIQQKVDDLRNNDNVDLVIMLSHGGIHVNGTGDDANLAAFVDGIDILCSGHYHELTPTPYNINDTLVFISGSYTDHVGQLDTTWDMTADGAKLASYHLNEIAIDDTTMGDATMQAIIEQYNQGIDADLLPNLGVVMATPIADLDFPLIVQEDQYIELNIGNLVADAMRTVASAIVVQATGDASQTFDMAVIPAGVLRDDLLPGMTNRVCFSDVFSVIPTGMTPDPDNRFAPGWPLVEAYLTGEEVRLIGEVAVSLSLALGDYTLWTNVSGVRYDYNPTGTALSKISTVHLCGNTLPSGMGGDEDSFSLNCTTTIDTSDASTLYHVVTDLYTLMMLHVATSQGVNIIPKHADGSAIDLTDPTDYMSTRIDMDPTTAGIQEIKTWMALLFFLQGMPDTDSNNLPNIPKVVYDQDTGVGMDRYHATN